MGPQATVDFLQKLVWSTPAGRDQDHIPVFVVSDPSVPDRTAAFFSGNESAVLDALVAGARRLEMAGASAIAMPCHTAHHWAPALSRLIRIPLLHIGESAVEALRGRLPAGGIVAVMATPGTLASGFYQRLLTDAGYVYLPPPPEMTETMVLPAIHLVKAGRVGEAGSLLSGAVASLFGLGAQAILLACTELPVALADQLPKEPRLLDATQALVDRCIAWARQQPD